MNSAIKTSALAFIILQIGLSLFYFLVPYTTTLMDIYFSYESVFYAISNVVRIILGALFAYYCWKENYRIVFYGIIGLFIIVLFSYLYRSINEFEVSEASGYFTMKFNLLYIGAHGLTIIFSNAWSNKWLRIYVILLLSTHILLTLMPQFLIIPFYNFIMIATIFTPAPFIFLIQNETNEKQIDEPEILDR